MVCLSKAERKVIRSDRLGIGITLPRSITSGSSSSSMVTEGDLEVQGPLVGIRFYF
jgi:hypothetical protein